MLRGSHDTLDYILKNTDVEDIWGVGKRLTVFLKNNGIDNALDLRECNENFCCIQPEEHSTRGKLGYLA